MHLQSFHIKNFRRLKDVHIELDPRTSIFVGSNNSGKTSATHIFQLFLGASKEPFSVNDFSANCWTDFDEIGSNELPSAKSLPTITLDLWFEVMESDLHRVVKLLPSLDWSRVPIGIRMEFAPKDSTDLLTRFRTAKVKANEFAEPKVGDRGGFHPWPETLTDYLKKHLSTEYKIFYYVLDHTKFNANYEENPDDIPQKLGDSQDSGRRILKSLLKVDFLTAQRYLSDTESKGRAEDLSKRLNRFYERNLQKYGGDFAAVKALAASEEQLNQHLSAVFEPTLKSLNDIGYPGFADPHLVIKSAFDPNSILTNHASVHYALRDPGKAVAAEQPLTLPDKYNGLGFKNLIYMVIEVLDFHQRWVEEEADDEPRPLLHVVIIEEPEVHLHVQLQQVFIRKIREILSEESKLFTSQIIVTTHSPHIIHESDFLPIRYFRRSSSTGSGNYSDVLNLSKLDASERNTHNFLLRYMKLTHCDLFFADAAILVEGNVERLLLPLMIEKVAPQLQSNYLSILELGGAFAHLFKNLIQFLGLTTLVITDIDSVLPAIPKVPIVNNDNDNNLAKPQEVGTEDEDVVKGAGTACMVDESGAVTSNQTLIQWIPRLNKISELLLATADQKAPAPTEGATAKIYVAFQMRELVTWKGETKDLAGRTFEEAFAYKNLVWCQDIKRSPLHLRVVNKSSSASIGLSEVIEKIHSRVNGNSFSKTNFALALIMADIKEWMVPNYIADGLQWLSKQLTATITEPVVAVTSTELETCNDSSN